TPSKRPARHGRRGPTFARRRASAPAGRSPPTGTRRQSSGLPHPPEPPMSQTPQTDHAKRIVRALPVVAVILVVLAAGLWVLVATVADRRVHRARQEIKALEQAVKAVAADSPNVSGEYPPSLEVLTQPQEGGRPALPPAALVDPWGHPYRYEPDNRD